MIDDEEAANEAQATAKRILDKITKPKKNKAAVELGRLGGLKGGPARAAKLTPERRSEIAKKASVAAQAKKKR